MTTPEQELGKQVRHLRHGRGWTQQDLTERLSAAGIKMHTTTVTRLEKGQRPVTLPELLALGRIFDIGMNGILGKPDYDERAQYLRQVLIGKQKDRDAADRRLRELQDEVAALEAEYAHAADLAEMVAVNLRAQSSS